MAVTHKDSASRRLLLGVFAVVVLAHSFEHVLQAAQIWWLGWQPADAGGALGLVAPQAVESEVLHTAYNIVVLAGIVGLVAIFGGRARRWAWVALIAQSWHVFEHLLLWLQALTGARPFGTQAPSSVVQLLVPRVELHLAYNAVVTALIITALFTAGYGRLVIPTRRYVS